MEAGKEEKMETMTEQHPKWGMFTDILYSRRCNHSLDNSRMILSCMNGVDVPKSLEYFQKNGADCDCEILWNIAEMDD